MKLYVSCDMEGTAGVCTWAQCDPSNAHEYPIYRRYMTREVRAAIDGAREAGATEVLINDSHWDMRNLLWDELPADVRMISGARKPFSMAQGLEGCRAAFFTGYHGKCGEIDSTLAHTYTSDTLYKVTINGMACSEAVLNAAMAGVHGTPLLLVTGDRTLVNEVTELMPWVTGVVVKDSIGYFAANSLTPAAAQAAIRAGAREAMSKVAKAKLFTFEAPITMDLEFSRVECADVVMLMPQFARTGGRGVRFVAKHYSDVYRAFVAAFRLAGTALAPA